MRRFCLTLCFLAVVSLSISPRVFAQNQGVLNLLQNTPAPTPSAVPSSPTASVPPSLAGTSTIQGLRETYRKETETYRNDERQYVIAKEQYNKLKTLASLEDAVRATQKVMSSRLAVFKTYFTMIKLTLQETNGIDIQQKQAQIDSLATLLEDLKKHQATVDIAVERTQVLKAAEAFLPLEKRITNNAYRTLSLIAYGRLQTVYDKTVAVYQEVQTQIEQEEKNALRLAEKRRGFTEIKRNIDSIDPKLKKIYEQISRPREQYLSGDHSSSVTELGKIYAEISRTVSLLREVAK